jgi:hypothetical protein
MLIVKSVGDIHGPVQQYFIAKARPGVNPSNSTSPTGAIVQHRSFYPAHLSGVSYLIYSVYVMLDKAHLF